MATTRRCGFIYLSCPLAVVVSSTRVRSPRGGGCCRSGGTLAALVPICGAQCWHSVANALLGGRREWHPCAVAAGRAELSTCAARALILVAGRLKQSIGSGLHARDIAQAEAAPFTPYLEEALFGN